MGHHPSSCFMLNFRGINPKEALRYLQYACPIGDLQVENSPKNHHGYASPSPPAAKMPGGGWPPTGRRFLNTRQPIP
jgi:hypothetical protein